MTQRFSSLTGKTKYRSEASVHTSPRREATSSSSSRRPRTAHSTRLARALAYALSVWPGIRLDSFLGLDNLLGKQRYAAELQSGWQQAAEM